MTDTYTYILEGRTPKVATLLEWARWIETADRVVRRTKVRGCTVSTVFLGLDHQFDDGPPLLFETMVFDASGTERPDLFGRYSTWDEAETGHRKIIDRVEADLAT